MAVITGVEMGNGGIIPGGKLLGLARCPHCGVATPNMNRLWSDAGTKNGDSIWAVFRCNTCAGVAACVLEMAGNQFRLTHIWPNEKVAHEDIPDPARTFLKQAFETLHAPDAAAVMAGSAVDAMLKAKGLSEGTLYSRIDKALEQNILTEGMAKWAHSVRLGSNRPRHADAEKPHVLPEEAKQSVEFAEALGQFLFVLTARIDRGIEAAKNAG